jgi:hypothetical protein
MGGFSVLTKTKMGALPQIVTGDFKEGGKTIQISDLKVTESGAPGTDY